MSGCNSLEDIKKETHHYLRRYLNERDRSQIYLISLDTFGELVQKTRNTTHFEIWVGGYVGVTHVCR
jgi:hypothetical protein